MGKRGFRREGGPPSCTDTHGAGGLGATHTRNFGRPDARGLPGAALRRLCRPSVGQPGVVPERGGPGPAGVRSGLRAKDPYPRHPWDPRAVSHPRMILDEFPDLVLKDSGDPPAE